MRIAITGNNRQAAVEKVANHFGVKPVVVNQPYLKDMYAYAAESYEHFDEENVVFDGSVIEDFGEQTHAKTEGESLMEEQVMLNALQNYDKVYVVTNAGVWALWKNMAELLPDKIVLVDTEDDIVL